MPTRLLNAITYVDQIEEIDIECKGHILSDSCFEAENEFHMGRGYQ